MADRQNSALRHLIFPLLLAAVYAAQLHFSGIFKVCALWSDHPKWWQFATHSLLSGNTVHLAVNALGLYVVCSQFVPNVRLGFILLYFLLFSAASSFLFFKFLMPPHAWLVGASSGVYSLIGFFSWFLRKGKLSFLGIRRFSAPVIPFLLALLVVEFVVATFWLPVVAWQLHWIAFGLSLLAAMACHAVYALTHWLAEREGSILRKTFMPGALALRQVRQLATVPVVESAE